jgi:predicted MPP superfamily phosphohydrolase
MVINRRQFLVLGGLALGACSSAVVSQEQGASSTTAVAGTVGNVPSTPTPRPRQTIGPAGWYAPERGDVRILVISDMNSRYGSTEYRPEVLEGIRLATDWQPDLVLCAGDMIAGQKISLSQAEVAAMWAAFDRQILVPLRQAGLPFAFTLGNHDASSYQHNGAYVFATDRQEAQRYWQAHQAALGLQYIEDSGFPFYYSFKQNDIFYLVWDASSANVSAEQVAWAERSLTSTEAQAAKLRLVIGHLPFYAISQGRDRSGEILNHADALRTLLEAHDVHTYISGHHHAYYPGHAGQLNLLHCGALGSGPRSWLNRTDAAVQTLTVLDITLDSDTMVYTTYNMNTRERVAMQHLPRQIVGPNGRVLRQDIAWADLTEAEKNQPYIPSDR